MSVKTSSPLGAGIKAQSGKIVIDWFTSNMICYVLKAENNEKYLD